MKKTFADCMLRSNYYVGVALAHARAQRTRIHATCALQISQKFAEKTFADGCETEKIFSLEGFLIYGILLLSPCKCGIEALGGYV